MSSAWHRSVALWSWCFLSWALLTRTVTIENAVFGIGVALVVGLALGALGGRVAGPWLLVWPPRLGRICVLAGDTAVRVVRANLKLTLTVWRPSRRPDTGVLEVETRMRTEGEILLVGVLTSLIVDNQLIDVDAESHRMWFHGVGLPEPARREAAINGEVEQRILRLTRGEHG